MGRLARSRIARALLYNTNTHAFTPLTQGSTSLLFTDSIPGTISEAAAHDQAINNAGEVVGCIGTAGSTWQAAIWQNGVITNLNTAYAGILPPGVVLNNATAIDNNGDMAGVCTDAAGHTMQAFVIYARHARRRQPGRPGGRLDLTIVLSHFGQTGATWTQGEFTGSGTVDVNDLTIVLAHFGQTLGTAGGASFSAVPEPGEMALGSGRSRLASLRRAEAEVDPCAREPLPPQGTWRNTAVAPLMGYSGKRSAFVIPMAGGCRSHVLVICLENFAGFFGSRGKPGCQRTFTFGLRRPSFGFAVDMPPRTGIGNSQPEVCQCNRNGVARTSFDCLCRHSHGFMPLSARSFSDQPMPTPLQEQPLRFGRSMRGFERARTFSPGLQTAHYHVLSFRRGGWRKCPLQCDEFIDAVGIWGTSWRTGSAWPSSQGWFTSASTGFRWRIAIVAPPPVSAGRVDQKCGREIGAAVLDGLPCASAGLPGAGRMRDPGHDA